MWCVKVRTGAFVARRHGKIFITGNSGFPKSMDVSKAIDKALGAERKKRGGDGEHSGNVDFGMKNRCPKCGKPYFSADPCTCPREDKQPITDAAKKWDGWGTCLKPAWEPIIVARKPLDGTVAHNVMAYGTGAINIDGCRVPINGERLSYGTFHSGGENGLNGTSTFRIRERHYPEGYQPEGRFPANLVHDGSQEVLELFPESKGQQANVTGNEPSHPTDGVCYGDYNGRHEFAKRGDSGSAARFFYCAKASKKDRNFGCEDYLTWEQGRELTRLLEQASSLLEKDISESTMRNLADSECSMFSFGSVSEGLSQTECRFITSTVIPLITVSRTCSSSHRSNTNGYILDAIRTSEESGISLARLAERLNLLKQGSTSGETDTAINAGIALFSVLSEIRRRARVGNPHPTIKPNALMRWLVRLVCPQGGTVLDPFMGSGSTGVACMQEGMDFIGIDMDEQYCDIAEKRISAAGQ